MAYKVIILYQLYMPSYFLGTFTEYPFLAQPSRLKIRYSVSLQLFRHRAGWHSQCGSPYYIDNLCHN